jgi:hypothetical protein
MNLFWATAIDVLPAVLAALPLALLLRALWEPTRLDVRQVVLAPAGCGKPDPLGADQVELNVLLFSDLHMTRLRVRPERLLGAMAGFSPDLVVFAGDLTDRSAGSARAIALMRRIRRLPNLAGVPCLAVPGNHDADPILADLAAAGFVVLQNESQTLACRGRVWSIIGLDDIKRGGPIAGPALAEAERAGIPPQQRLVLAHNPDCLLTFPAGQAGWFLGGHYHGGQIWAPFRLEFYLLRRDKLPRIGYYKGCITWQGLSGYISRGLGCAAMPLRLFSLPELTLLQIRPGLAGRTGPSEEPL